MMALFMRLAQETFNVVIIIWLEEAEEYYLVAAIERVVLKSELMGGLDSEEDRTKSLDLLRNDDLIFDRII